MQAQVVHELGIQIGEKVAKSEALGKSTLVLQTCQPFLEIAFVWKSVYVGVRCVSPPPGY